MAKQISFGDNVRVRATSETTASGVASRIGQVYGVTTPSVTGIEHIGASMDDCALNVHFSETEETMWFAPELLELVDHAPGNEIRIKGVSKKWTRSTDGSWKEENIGPKATRRPRRKFW